LNVIQIEEVSNKQASMRKVCLIVEEKSRNAKGKKEKRFDIRSLIYDVIFFSQNSFHP
jgi:hypothetical protein